MFELILFALFVGHFPVVKGSKLTNFIIYHLNVWYDYNVGFFSFDNNVY